MLSTHSLLGYKPTCKDKLPYVVKFAWTFVILGKFSFCSFLTIFTFGTSGMTSLQPRTRLSSSVLPDSSSTMQYR